METITIPASRVPPSATYIADVLHYGHVPGVLSGANLKGKALKYAATYAQSREQAKTLAQEYGVVPEYVMLNRGTPCKPLPRRCLVWTKDGQPVEVVLA